MGGLEKLAIGVIMLLGGIIGGIISIIEKAPILGVISILVGIWGAWVVKKTEE